MPTWMFSPRRGEPWVAAIVLLADQVTKWIVHQTIHLHDSVPVIPGLLNFTHVLNEGAAFGLLNAAQFRFKPVIVASMALVALVAIIVYAGRFATETASARYGLALVLAGAVGNLIDRATRGHVLDFVDLYWESWHFWAFNVADAAITMGAALIVVDMLFAKRDVSTAI
jgi:signal peptidase II